MGLTTWIVALIVAAALTPVAVTHPRSRSPRGSPRIAPVPRVALTARGWIVKGLCARARDY